MKYTSDKHGKSEHSTKQPPTGTAKEFHDRYQAATRKMQSGVAHALKLAPPRSVEYMHKDLRVGMNNALVQLGALAGLLIEKGLLTESEYWETLALAMEEEVTRYEQKLSALTGYRVSLGEAGDVPTNPDPNVVVVKN